MMTQLEEIAGGDRLERALTRVAKGSIHPGWDGQSASAFLAQREMELATLRSELLSGTFAARPRIRFRVPKLNGGERSLSLSCVRDRVVESALLDWLSPRVEPLLPEHVHGYRSGRSVITALAAARATALKHDFVAHIDIAKFFDSVEWTGLSTELAAAGVDTPLTGLILDLVSSPASEGEQILTRERGLPQGSLLSPLLSNLALLPIDRWLRTHVSALVRYGDDMLLFGGSMSEMNQRINELQPQLALQGFLLQDSKTKIVPTSEAMTFLGERVSGTGSELPLGLRTSATPPRVLYITRPGVMLHKNGQRIEVWERGESQLSIPSARLGAVITMGQCNFSSEVVRLASYNSIPMIWLTTTGRYLGHLDTGSCADPAIEQRQWAITMDNAARLRIAVRMVEAKLRNSAKLLEEFAEAGEPGPRRSILRLGHLARRCVSAQEVGVLNGIEGAGAAVYFRSLAALLPEGFRFRRRSAHPPLDPANSLLSFVYTLLHFEVYAALVSSKLNVHAGVLHNPRPEFAALACDCMEEFRAPVADAFVLRFLRDERPDPTGFRRDSAGCWMTPEVRRSLVRAWERHLWDVPPNGSKHWRDRFLAQARALVELLRGRASEYKAFLWSGQREEVKPCSSQSVMT